MKLAKGNMWLHSCNTFLFTANNVVNQGKLVMGAGAAKQAKELYPTAPALLGAKILTRRNPQGFYGLAFCQQHNCRLGAFQTKYHWNGDSSLELIEASIRQLEIHAVSMPSQNFFLNFPGIGLGGLKREEVLPLLTTLPDNVTIWER